MFLDAEASVFQNLPTFVTRREAVNSQYHQLLQFTTRICQGLPETSGSKISSEIHKDKPRKISCHCDLELTTSFLLFFLHTPSPEQWSSPKSQSWTGKEKPEELALNPSSQGRRRLEGSAPRSSATSQHVRPGSHWERVFRKRDIRRRLHFARIPALPRRGRVPAASPRPSPALPGGLRPPEGQPLLLARFSFREAPGLQAGEASGLEGLPTGPRSGLSLPNIIPPSAP